MVSIAEQRFQRSLNNFFGKQIIKKNVKKKKKKIRI